MSPANIAKSDTVEEHSKKQNGLQEESHGNLLILGLVAPLAGIGAGVLGAFFRLALEKANHLRNLLVAWAHQWNIGGFAVLLTVITVSAAVAAWLVRRFSPHASGSGIPQVEAVLNDELPQPPARLIVVKFIGGVLAIGSGLALGREGPTIQMGASISYLTGKWLKRSRADCRVLLAAGAGAGLATAFNAPISGAVFVLEELLKRFESRIAIAALAASASAIWVERLILGDHPCFAVGHLMKPDFIQEPLYLLLGMGAGLAGLIYNKTLLKGLKTADHFSALPIELRAALMGAAVAAVAWFAPALVGGGDPLTQRALNGAGVLTLLPVLYILRLGLITGSYSVGTPGGLFAPLLVLGAVLGLWVGKLCVLVLPAMGIQPVGFALVGMAALFTGIVRAPVTGIILVTEMTANVNMLLPMIVACFAAMLVPTFFGDAPIYDALGARLFAHEREQTEKPAES